MSKTDGDRHTERGGDRQTEGFSSGTHVHLVHESSTSSCSSQGLSLSPLLTARVFPQQPQRSLVCSRLESNPSPVHQSTSALSSTQKIIRRYPGHAICCLVLQHMHLIILMVHSSM